MLTVPIVGGKWISEVDILLEVRDLKKYYPSGRGRGGQRLPVRAVDGVSFSLERGETLAIVGESGCGKTTTTRILLGLETPTSGVVYFKDQNLRTLKGDARRAYRRAVQAVMQDPWSSLNPRMRVREIIAEPLVVSGRASKGEVKTRVDELLQDVGLEPEAGNNFPHEFSGGQRQRIAIARALSVHPELIILDEPVSALDVSIRAQLMNLLKDVQTKYEVSYLLIAHNLATVRYLSQRVLVMYLGRIVEEGRSDELFSRPRNPYTVSLIAAAGTEPTPNQFRLSGDIPSPERMPTGCRLHSRCWLRRQLGGPQICSQEDPPLLQVSPNQWSACHFVSELRSELVQ